MIMPWNKLDKFHNSFRTQTKTNKKNQTLTKIWIIKVYFLWKHGSIAQKWMYGCVTEPSKPQTCKERDEDGRPNKFL